MDRSTVVCVCVCSDNETQCELMDQLMQTVIRVSNINSHFVTLSLQRHL